MFLGSIVVVYLSVPRCFDCCSFVVQFQIGKCESSNFVLFQSGFDYSGSFAIPSEVEDQLVNVADHLGF